jgi:O-methyltransferase
MYLMSTEPMPPDSVIMQEKFNEMHSGYRKTIFDFVRLARQTILPDLHVNDTLIDTFVKLQGTPVFQAFFIIDSLSKTQLIEGDICEYGVAWGRTSALIAATLNSIGSSKGLWLYDSFEGLPKPHEKDELLDDICGLGTIDKYQGVFSAPEDFAKKEIEQVAFPSERVTICKGWIEASTLPERSPEKISFCYLDMDFYRSTKDVLLFLLDRMPKGGRVVLDDYKFFSKGPYTAVEEIIVEYPGAFAVRNPYEDKFALLIRQ